MGDSKSPIPPEAGHSKSSTSPIPPEAGKAGSLLGITALVIADALSKITAVLLLPAGEPVRREPALQLVLSLTDLGLASWARTPADRSDRARKLSLPLLPSVRHRRLRLLGDHAPGLRARRVQPGRRLPPDRTGVARRGGRSVGRAPPARGHRPPRRDVVHSAHAVRRAGAGRDPGTRAGAADRARRRPRVARPRARRADPLHAAHSAVAELLDGRLP